MASRPPGGGLRRRPSRKPWVPGSLPEYAQARLGTQHSVGATLPCHRARCEPLLASLLPLLRLPHKDAMVLESRAAYSSTAHVAVPRDDLVPTPVPNRPLSEEQDSRESHRLPGLPPG